MAADVQVRIAHIVVDILVVSVVDDLVTVFLIFSLDNHLCVRYCFGQAWRLRLPFPLGPDRCRPPLIDLDSQRLHQWIAQIDHRFVSSPIHNP